MILHYSEIPKQPWPLLEERVLANIPVPRAQALRRKRDPADRNASLLGLLLLRSARAALGWTTDWQDLVYPGDGKPGLPGPGDFSISHGGTCVACAVARDGAIGLDVEPEGALAAAALRLVASAAERARVEAGALTATALAVAKEAVVKALGGSYAELGAVTLGEGWADYRGRRLVLHELVLALAPGHVAMLADTAVRAAPRPLYVSPEELLGSVATSR